MLSAMPAARSHRWRGAVPSTWLSELVPADDRNLGLQTVWRTTTCKVSINRLTSVRRCSTKVGGTSFRPKVAGNHDGAALASMMETHGINVWRNARAIVERREKHGARIFDTPKDFFPQFVRDQRRARSLRDQAPLLQAGAGEPTSVRQDGRAVLDEDPRPVLWPGPYAR